MAAGGAGRGARRIEQHRIERRIRAPMRARRPATTSAASPVRARFSRSRSSRLALMIERGHLPPGGGELQRLAARRGAQSSTRRPSPAPSSRAGRLAARSCTHHAPSSNPSSRSTAVPRASRTWPGISETPPSRSAHAVGCRGIAQGQVERRRLSQRGGDRGRMLAPARRHCRRQRRRCGQGRTALDQCREHPVRQPPRAAAEQRQPGGDHRMGRRVQPQHLRQHQPQHRARLGIVGQHLAVAQSISASRSTSQRSVSPAIAGASARSLGIADALARGVCGPLERLAPPQHGIEPCATRRGGAGRPGMSSITRALAAIA